MFPGSGWLKIKPEYVDGLTDEVIADDLFSFCSILFSISFFAFVAGRDHFGRIFWKWGRFTTEFRHSVCEKMI